MLTGINLGSGKNWSLSNWVGLDKTKGENDRLDATTVFPQKNNSVIHVFSAHFFEHIDNETASNLLKEIYRVLLPGGYVRIIVPDIDKIIQHHQEGEDMFGITTPGQNWVAYEIPSNSLNILLHLLSNFDHAGDNRGFYRGPPQDLAKNPELVKTKLESLSTSEFCEWVLSHVPVEDPKTSPQHINWWNWKKMKQFLMDNNFAEIELSEYQKSSAVAMRGEKFDSSNRRGASLYVEARKL